MAKESEDPSKMAHQESKAKWSAMGPYLLSTLRIVAAFMFILYGTQNLFGFPSDTSKSSETVQFLSQLGIGSILLIAGGILLLLGLFTRPVAFVLSGEMAVAYFQFHFPQGPWPTLNGGTDAVLYCFVCLYFSAVGGGVWSLNNWLKTAKMKLKFNS
jgi:putative oxidoreductase